MSTRQSEPSRKIVATITSKGRVGLFLDLNSSQQGFIHVSEIGRRSEDQSARAFKAGQQVTAWVMDYNPDTNRVALTMIDPKTTIHVHQLKPGMKLDGTVVGIEDFGAFVDVGAEQTGLIHISRLSRTPVASVTDIVKEGDRVTVWVEDVDIRRQRLSLSLTPPPSIDWRTLRSGQKLPGIVVSIKDDLGAFVDIDAEKSGLVHISKLRRVPVNAVSDVVKVGQSVTVWVEKVDLQRERLSLSLLPPPSVDWQTLRPGQKLTGTVVNIKEGLGAFVDVDAERDGLVHVSKLSRDYVRSVADVVQVGDKVTVWVERVDHQGLSLSMIAPVSRGSW